MSAERTRKSKALRAVAYFALSAVGLTMLLPFLWMVSTSLKSPAYAIEFPPRWIPSEPLVTEVGGEARPVAEVKGEAGTRVAVLRYSPEGVHIRGLAPGAGRERVVPEAHLVPVRVVKLHWENYANAWRGDVVSSRLRKGGSVNVGERSVVSEKMSGRLSSEK